MKTISSIFAVLAVVLLAGCSTSKDGVSVGNVSNTECSHQTRAVEPHKYTLKLTREGTNINGEFANYPIGCVHGDLYVDCQQTGSNLDINVKEARSSDGSGIFTTCQCYVNIYFTLYDVEGDKFIVKLDGREVYNISFENHTMVEIDRATGELTYYPED